MIRTSKLGQPKLTKLANGILVGLIVLAGSSINATRFNSTTGNPTRPSLVTYSVTSTSANLDESSSENAKATEREARRSRRARPRHLALTHQDKWLWVGCENGELLQVQTNEPFQVQRLQVAQSIEGLAWLASSHELCWLDAQSNELVICKTDKPEALDKMPVARGVNEAQLNRIAIPHGATGFSVINDNHLAITFRWRRHALFLQRSPTSSSWNESRRIDIELPLNPEQVVSLSPPASAPSTFLVTSSFNGRMAIVDTAQAQVTESFEIDGHFVRGAQVTWQSIESNDNQSQSTGPHKGELIFTYERGNPDAPLTINSIEFGDAMNHRVGKLTVEVASNQLSVSNVPEVFELGFAGLAAADPSGLHIFENDWLIPLSGVHQIVRVSPQKHQETRIDVGKHPLQVIVDHEGERAYIAAAFAERIDVVDLESNRISASISISDGSPKSQAELGEELFFDATKSRDNWMSCHSCHTLGHTNGQLADTMGDGSHGTPKRVLSLRGVGRTDPWAWNGTVKELADQIDKSATSTMHGRRLSAKEIHQLQAYLASLPAPPAVMNPSNDMMNERKRRGEQLFQNLGCVTCHVPPLTFTTNGRFDVDLQDENGETRFNPPSLRGVGQLPLLFHDGRARSLREVIETFEHQLPRSIDEQEQEALLTYLLTL